MVRWGWRGAGMGMLMAALGTGSAAAQGTGTARKPAVKGVKLLHTDVQQSELKTLFVDIPFLVGVELEWKADEGAIVQASELQWSVKVDGELSGQGTVDLAADRLLPSELVLSDINGVVRDSGDHVVEVNIVAGETTTGDSKEVVAIKGGVSLIPLIVVIALAVLTQKVELSLFAGIFVAACIVNGNLKDGFKRTLDGYLLGAINDAGHIYVILFTFFLSGLVAIIEKSGGMLGLSTTLIRYAKTSQSAQMIAFCCGLLIFFDDYANCLVVGVTVVPITDLLYVSREKLAYIVDTTAAPIASIIPVSSWVGFEVGLIQDELDKIQEANGDVLPVGLGSGFSIFLTSIKYRFYPILLLVLQLILIASRRDFGPMLVAERRTQVYGRQDGGPGRFEAAGKLSNTNAPSKGTPLLWHNMLLPIVVLVIFIFVILVNTGTEYTSVVNPSFLDKIESADSYEALLWGTFATVVIVVMFYAVQFKKDGKLVPPSFEFLKRSKHKKGVSVARPLLGVYESIDSFLYGVDKVFPAIIVLTLAWAVAAAMVDVGADRLVASAIENDLEPTKLPTLVFILSALLALAIGTSWGTMAITFPLVTGPTWYASQDPELLTAVIASVLSGAVCGDHVSPISDTTVLSSVATGCNLMKHVYTQAPYVLVVALWSVLVGTLPVGNGTYGPGVAILLGILLLLATVALLGVQVLDKKGRFDPLTELYMKLSPASSLHQLKADTAYAATSGMSATEAGSSNDESSDLPDDTGTSAADPVKAGAQQHSAEEQAGIQQTNEDGIGGDTPHPGELAKV